MIKLFVSDIDGTLMAAPHQQSGSIEGVCDENLQALADLERNGIRVALATGRDHRYLSEFPKHPALILPTVGFNGGYVYMDGAVVYQNPFTTQEIRGMIENFPDLAHGFVGCTINNNWVHYTLEDCRRVYFRRKGQDRRGFDKLLPVSLEEFLADETNPPLCHVFFSIEEPHVMEDCFRRVNEAYSGTGLRVTITSPRSIDFLKAPDSKAHGIGVMAERMGIAMDEVAVVGDGHNDIEMFQAVKESFCMDTAPEEVYCHAKRRVSSVAEAVKIVLEENVNIIRR